MSYLKSSKLTSLLSVEPPPISVNPRFQSFAFICVHQCSSVVILTSSQFQHNDNQKRTRGCALPTAC